MYIMICGICLFSKIYPLFKHHSDHCLYVKRAKDYFPFIPKSVVKISYLCALNIYSMSPVYFISRNTNEQN